MAKSGPEVQTLDRALTRFIHLTPTPPINPVVQELAEDLGPGEQQAIGLAHSLPALLLMDERLGRTAARRLGVRVAGTVGVVLRAKEMGLIPEVIPLLKELRARGYWLSDGLLDAAMRLAGEV